MSIHSPRILVVEDEAATRQVLAEKLTDEGFDVVLAKNGIEGLKLLSQKKPDMVLVDIVMPRMDGFTMIEKIRAEEEGANLPVVVLTNLTLNDERLKVVVQYEPSYYFVKTEWPLQQVVQKIKERLEMV